MGELSLGVILRFPGVLGAFDPISSLFDTYPKRISTLDWLEQDFPNNHVSASVHFLILRGAIQCQIVTCSLIFLCFMLPWICSAYIAISQSMCA